MNYLSVENLSKDYGERILFEGLTFGLSRGDKMALIANNGTGKSSLLKIIANEDIPDSGTVTLRAGIRIGSLAQEPNFDKNKTLEELISSSNTELIQTIKDYEKALEEQAKEYNSHTIKQLDVASAKMDETKAWDYERKMKQVLSKFNIDDISQKVSSLSGGQKKRVALAMLLLDEPELLLLDEPTNHLDIEMIEWLEKYLQQQKITLLMVTHDRYFLDRVCNHILELEGGKLYHHRGNYAYFLEKREERETAFDTEVSKAGKLMKKELEWIRRSPKARTTKSKSRITNFEKIKDKANSRTTKQELNLDIKMSRVGGKILELKKVRKSFGDLSIMDGFDYRFKKGERIGIVGRNGVGKSTFLNILTGAELADSGKVNPGETIVFGYFTQAGIELKEDKRVIEVLKDIAEVIVMADGKKVTASQFLQHFMFAPEMQHTYVSKLSGGERRRLYLLTILIKNPNFLILDEPTNDLDLLTLNKLEEFLLQFKGCLLLVSHDRYFMDKLTDHLFIFNGNGVIEDEYCSYSEYRKKLNTEEKKTKKTQKTDTEETLSTTQSEKKKKLSYKDKYEYEQLEIEIEKLEKEKNELETALEDTDMSYEKMMDKSAQIGKIIELIDEKSFRWMELDELANEM
ncbi:MAG TPA: ABC-F family ATP-binding cassette domain-containing protein [Flavobacteriales bacterium]|nr:ABC-F family ATP-binding cassette domain-containing protein [Flavobacteriales bacterium]HIN39555.1 ABC-F family ATP-binding cassette domain-containing protein [Flavobacteriales bacterium]